MQRGFGVESFHQLSGYRLSSSIFKLSNYYLQIMLLKSWEASYCSYQPPPPPPPWAKFGPTKDDFKPFKWFGVIRNYFHKFFIPVLCPWCLNKNDSVKNNSGFSASPMNDGFLLYSEVFIQPQGRVVVEEVLYLYCWGGSGCTGHSNGSQWALG